MCVCLNPTDGTGQASVGETGFPGLNRRGFPSSVKGGAESHTLLPPQVGCHIGAVTWSHSQHVRRSEGSSLYYSDMIFKKKRKTNKNELRRGGGVQAR